MRSGISAMKNHEKIARRCGTVGSPRGYRKLPDEDHALRSASVTRGVDRAAASVFSSEEEAIYPPNATGFNLQMAKHRAVANITHAR